MDAIEISKEVEEIPFSLACDIPVEPPVEWLVEELWLKQGCGIIGGQPKCCKSWLGLDIAFSVASGTPCLGKYEVPESGRVLVYMAEDKASSVRNRLSEIASSRNLTLEKLPLFILTPPQMLLDNSSDSKALEEVIRNLEPKFVLLDPLVRLHRLDENNAREISHLLGFIRSLEKRYKTAIAIAHHSNKRGAGRPGQGLRGSSDLHAFGDSNLYLSRKGSILTLRGEHRSAMAPEPVSLKLAESPSLHLLPLEKWSLQESKTAQVRDIKLEIKEALEKDGPMTQKELRQKLGIKNETLGQTVREMVKWNLLEKGPQGLVLKEVDF